MQAVFRYLALATLCLCAAPAGAAGPFDGTWTGRSVTDFGWCPPVYQVTVEIRDGEVTGEMVSNADRITVVSTVDKRGRLARVLGYNGRTVLKKLGGRMDARTARITWMGHGQSRRSGEICYGAITLEKVSEGR